MELGSCCTWHGHVGTLGSLFVTRVTLHDKLRTDNYLSRIRSKTAAKRPSYCSGNMASCCAQTLAEGTGDRRHSLVFRCGGGFQILLPRPPLRYLQSSYSSRTRHACVSQAASSVAN